MQHQVNYNDYASLLLNLMTALRVADHRHLYYWIHTLCLLPVSFLFDLSRQFS